MAAAFDTRRVLGRPYSFADVSDPSIVALQHFVR